MLFKKSKKEIVSTIRQFIFVEIPFETVAPVVMEWEQSAWWPKKCGMKFIRQSAGPLEEGAVLKQKILWLSFDVEIAQLVPRQEIKLIFRKGILRGTQTVKVEARSNGTRVEYELISEPKGLINKLFWPAVYQRMFSSSTQKILNAVRDYAIKNLDSEKKYE